MKLFLFGRPGQFASMIGSDIGIIVGIEFSVEVDLELLQYVGGIGGVRFLETDLMMSGDERTLVCTRPDVLVLYALVDVG